MDDLIRRQAAIEYCKHIIDAMDTDGEYNLGFADGLEFCINHLSTMPSAQPERKKGEWLRDPPERESYALYKCSVCGECWLHWWASAMTVEKMTKEVRCCPHCGAEMVSNMRGDGNETKRC